MQNKSQAKDLQVLLVTFSQGDMLTDWFGHTALAVKDTFNQVSRIYNFGLYSFDEGFIKRFVFGRLIFWAGDADYSSTIYRYASDRRSVFVQELNLNPENKLDLAQKLEIAVKPENASYLYHHYYDNCATRLRDLIDEAASGALSDALKTPANETYRELTLRYTAKSSLMQWLLMFLMNDSIDKPIRKWDEMFLPDILSEYVGEVMVTDSLGNQKPLVKNSYIEFDAGREPVPAEASLYPLWTLFSGILLAFLIVLIEILLKQYNRLFILLSIFITFVLGIIGFGLFFMAYFTDHLVTHGNENILLANPMTLLLFFISVILFFKKNKKTQKIFYYLWMVHAFLAVFALLLKVIPLFDQNNYMALSLILPIYLGFAYVLYNYKSGKISFKRR